MFHDWHEHDGCIVESKFDSWKSLNEAIESERTLFDYRDEDFYLRAAVFPPSYDWILRYNIDQDDETD